MNPFRSNAPPPGQPPAWFGAAIRKARDHYVGELERMTALITEIASRTHRSVEDEINAVPGRRMFFTLNGKTVTKNANTTQDTVGQPFTSTAAAAEANMLVFQTPKDGYWVQTHYPVAMWRITAAEGAPVGKEGRWRPCTHWTLPTQVMTTDFISLSLNFSDAGPERDFESRQVVRGNTDQGPSSAIQAGTMIRHVPSSFFSNPLVLKQLPVPTMFKAKSAIMCQPKYENVNFGTYTTAGLLCVALPGYKIAN